MTLEIRHTPTKSGLTANLDGQAKRRCRTARQYERAGDYEAACEALGGFWRGVGERPLLDGLSEPVAVEILLRVAVLTSCVGYVRPVEGAQEIAKNLLSECERRFKGLDNTDKVAETYCEIGLCYWRADESDNARVWLRDAISLIADSNAEIKALSVLRLAVVESSSSNLRAALSILTEYAPIFERTNSDWLKGCFHVNLASTLKNLGENERNQEFTDRALVEFEAARFHFENARHRRYLALAENQLGFLFLRKKKYSEAHYHLDRARKLFVGLRDRLRTGQVDETRGQLFLAEGNIKGALSASYNAVRILQQGDAQIPLIEALITLGIAQVRSGSVQPGRATFERAIQLAETNVAHELLILAVTAALEELSEHLEMLDKVALYARAQGVVTNVHRGEIVARLCSCAFLIVQDVMQLDNLTAQSVSNNGSKHTTDGLLPGEQVDWPHVSIREMKRQLERAWIMRALLEASGEPTKAADLLGLRHGDLDSMIERRHKDLITARKPKRTRHRSIIKR